MASKRGIRRREEAKERASACKRKIKYPDQTAAVSAKIRTDADDINLRTYRCKFCDGWHIGHKRRKVTRIKSRVSAPGNSEHA